MRGNQRREEILKRLRTSTSELPGSELAKEFGVSRQVIVQDIALLRAEDHVIISTNLGYILQEQSEPTRVFKVLHSDEQSEEEMNLIVDNGGTIQDVFIYHRIYGIIRAEMNIRSRRDIQMFLQNLSSGKSSLLKNVTGGYHYHTISAPTETILDSIQKQLQEHGFLAPLQEYEPVDFWTNRDRKNAEDKPE